jgi:hypothetical protein
MISRNLLGLLNIQDKAYSVRLTPQVQDAGFPFPLVSARG